MTFIVAFLAGAGLYWLCKCIFPRMPEHLGKASCASGHPPISWTITSNTAVAWDCPLCEVMRELHTLKTDFRTQARLAARMVEEEKKNE